MGAQLIVDDGDVVDHGDGPMPLQAEPHDARTAMTATQTLERSGDGVAVRPERVSPEWVRDFLGLASVDAVYRAIRRGELPHVRLGRSVLLFRDQIERFRAGA
jgi:excisionase family DNA binding protein